MQTLPFNRSYAVHFNTNPVHLFFAGVIRWYSVTYPSRNAAIYSGKSSLVVCNLVLHKACRLALYKTCDIDTQTVCRVAHYCSSLHVHAGADHVPGLALSQGPHHNKRCYAMQTQQHCPTRVVSTTGQRYNARRAKFAQGTPACSVTLSL